MKKYCLKFPSIQDSFFLLSLFSIYKIVDSMEIYINIGTVMKNPEMLKFVLDHPKTKNMRKHADKKLPYVLYVLRHVSDQL